MRKQAKRSKTATPQTGAGDDTSTDRQERIRRRAYELWEQSGRPHGREFDHWRQAEQEIAKGNSQ